MSDKNNAPMNWLVELVVDEDWDAQLFIRHFRSERCRVVKEDDGRFYLTSSQFKGVVDHREVVRLAQSFLTKMNGVAKIIAPWFRPVNMGNLKSIGANGGHGHVIRAGPIKFRVPQQVPEPELVTALSLSQTKAEFWVEVAGEGSRLDRALRLFGTRPHTWQNLYGIHELIREDVGGIEKLKEKNWVSDTKLKRFRSTANDPDVAGDEARHQMKQKSTTDPLRYDDAVELIRRLLSYWLQEKLP